MIIIIVVRLIIGNERDYDNTCQDAAERVGMRRIHHFSTEGSS